MTTPPDGMPWWAWAVVAVLALLIPALSGVVVAFIQRPVKRAAQAAAEQTENNHADAEHPNLRDELTVTRQAAERAVELAERAAESAERLEDAHSETRRDIGGLREDVRRGRVETEGLRNDHRETRDWIGTEALERRKIAEAQDRLTQAVNDHIDEARERDRLLEAHEQTIRVLSQLVAPPPTDPPPPSD